LDGWTGIWYKRMKLLKFKKKSHFAHLVVSPPVTIVQEQVKRRTG